MYCVEFTVKSISVGTRSKAFFTASNNGVRCRALQLRNANAFVYSPPNIMCRSERLTRCEAPGARGGWHAPCLVARGQRTLSRQGHRRERERECGITRASWPISSHDDVGAGHELHSVSTWTICSRKTGYDCLLHECCSQVQCPRSRCLIPPRTTGLQRV